MRGTYFLKRILLILTVTFILWALFASLVFYYMTKPSLIESRTEDLLIQSKWLAQSIPDEDTPPKLIQDLIQEGFRYLDTWIFLNYRSSKTNDFSIHTDLREITEEDENVELDDKLKEDLLNKVSSLHDKSLEKHKSITEFINFPDYKYSLLCVATPVFPHNQTNASTPYATVIMVQPHKTLRLTLQNLNLSLLLATLIVYIVIFMPVVLVTNRIVAPIHHIRALALAITRGDFSKKAQVIGKDEISDLGLAINQMSDTLSNSMHQLNIERNQLKQIIEGMADGIIAMDKFGQITLVNTMAWKLFILSPEHYTAEELLENTGTKELFKRCMIEKEVITKMIDLEIDSSKIQCHISPVLNSRGQVSTIIGLFRDVTEQAKLDQTRRDYVANVSHELRSPLTSMRALIEPLRDGMVKRDEDRKRYYDILLRENIRLSNLINDMLELSRLQSGNAIHVEQIHLNANTIVDEIYERTHLVAQEHGIEFIKDIPSTSLPMIWGDRDRIIQILTIFIDNAIKFSPEKGKIIFRATPEVHYLKFSIQDSGKGVNPQDLPYLFERFYKSDKSHNEEGTGLGLSIAHTIAELLGMQVGVTSVPGEGATFFLRVRYSAENLIE